jgi:hypothetical protein
MRRYSTVAVVAVCLVLAGVYWFYRPAVIVADHLCEYVFQTLHLECVDVLEATDGMHPGAVTVLRPKSDDQPFGRAEIPRLDLLRESCRIPGTNPEVIAAGMSAPAPVALPAFTYDLQGALKEGVQIPVPKLEGTTITAGPNLSSVASVRITNKKAWIESWDAGAALQAFASCNIKQTCIDLIQSSHYKVISTTAVVDGLSYEFKDESSNELVLSVGGGKAVDIQNGGHVEMKSGSTASLDTTAPFVVGVRFFPDQIFASQPTCAEPIKFAAEGLAAVTASGGGGKGNIGGPFTQTAKLGEKAAIDKRGTEQSECEAGLDLTVSEARVAAQVDSPGPGKLRFSYDYALSGGHYDTVAACPLGKWVGKTGHDNTTNVSAELVGRIRILVRTSQTPRLSVLRPNLQGGTLQVQDPLGQSVMEIKQPPKEHTEGPPQDTVSAPSIYYLEGPGLYTVEYSARVNVAQGGAGRDNKSDQGLLEVNVD